MEELNVNFQKFMKTFSKFNILYIYHLIAMLKNAKAKKNN